MANEIELWRFVLTRLEALEAVMLLVVAASHGSSPGRAGYKMAVAADGELCGSIGGGVMEVRLVEQSRAFLSEPGGGATGHRDSAVHDEVHQKHSPDASGMICSGRQTVILKLLSASDLDTVQRLIDSFDSPEPAYLRINPNQFRISSEARILNDDYSFVKNSDSDFVYLERLSAKNNLYIIGGGHCALALSEIMSRMDFRILILDDRHELNTLEKNQFANEVIIIDDYDDIAEHISPGASSYVVVMTLGYTTDEIVVRRLLDKDFKYFGVLGSKAKMATLLKELRKDGASAERLSRIRTPIGLPINSRTPEEIAVSIAAEIISVRNA